eukprot:c14395_g1_i1 orf=315-587(+)
MKMAMCRCLGTDSYVKIFWSRRRLASQCQRMWTTIKPCAAVYALDPSSLNRGLWWASDEQLQVSSLLSYMSECTCLCTFTVDAKLRCVCL